MTTPTIITRQKAIALKCKDCNYDPLDRGSWLEQVASCASTDCPLHPYRPMPRRKSPSNYPISQLYSAPVGKTGERGANLQGDTHTGRLASGGAIT